MYLGSNFVQRIVIVVLGSGCTCLSSQLRGRPYITDEIAANSHFDMYNSTLTSSSAS